LISGRVVAARPSDRIQHPGYLRLTLATIAVADKPEAVRTSSHFVKGDTARAMDHAPQALLRNVSRTDLAGATAATPQDAQVSIGERFIFRLKETVPGPMDRLPSQLPVIPALNSRTEHP